MMSDAPDSKFSCFTPFLGWSTIILIIDSCDKKIDLFRVHNLVEHNLSW